jgi:hypothetical protein
MTTRLKRTSILKQLLQILLALKVRVTTNVLLLNEDVRHGALAGDLSECALDSGSFLCKDKLRLAIIPNNYSYQLPERSHLRSLLYLDRARKKETHRLDPTQAQ